jgi:O-antigen/teichoic acid export membrane protein
MEKTLKEKTTTALIWSFIDKFGQQIIYFGTGIFLGRLLSPDDYGLTGSLMIFIAISTLLVGSGYGRAIMNRPQLRDSELATIYNYNVIVGLLLYALLFFCAPLIADFYNQPLLTPISRILFLNIISTSLLNVPEIILTKKMDLDRIAKSSVLSLFPSSIIAVIAAFMGYGVWALVIQSVMFTFLKMLFFTYYSGWKPKKDFDRGLLKELFPFSIRVLIINLINAIANNIYYLIIGKVYNMSQTGFFTQANKYQDIPTGLINNTFRSVSMPLLAGVNDDKERMKRVLRKLIKTVAFIAFPVLLLMVLIAKPMFVFLITDKWLPSVPIFQILCVSGIFMVFNNVIQESILSKGKSKELLYVEIVKKAVLIGLILITYSKGLIWMAAGWAVSWFISLVLSLYLSWKIVGYSLIEFIKDCFAYFIIAVVLCAAAWGFTRYIDNNLLFLITSGSFVGILYLLICRFFKLETFMEMYDWAIKKFKK